MLQLLFFNWRKIAWLCCVGFCHRHASATIIHIFPPLGPPSPRPFHPSRSSQSTRLGSLCYIAISHQLSVLHMIVYLEKTTILKDPCTPMFTVALFVISRTWKQTRCPQPDEWIKKTSYTYTLEYGSAMKMNEFESV